MATVSQESRTAPLRELDGEMAVGGLPITHQYANKYIVILLINVCA